MPTIDKLVVTNQRALRAKYGATGLKKISAAVAGMITADKARGIVTRLVSLDSAAALRSARATPPKTASDWEGAVRAVDLLWEHYRPSYVLLLGADDVVPEAVIANSIPGDGDPFVPSDLPYACDLPASWTLPASERFPPSALMNVTRAVGRLPDIVGGTDPTFVVRLLSTAATWTSRGAGDYHDVFGLSAAAWEDSTRQSITILSSPTTPLHLSPPSKTPLKPALFATAKVHFINCHGADFTPDWFGQAKPINGHAQPVDVIALSPADIDGRVPTATLVAAECCYGSMHGNPVDFDGRLPMMWAYLQSGAYACVGSSTIAYGPAAALGQADLLCRFFLEAVSSGSSCGRALLEARQRFIREVANLGPDDVKTLMQFNLLGDPSIHPVRTASPPGPVAATGPKAGLVGRRTALRAVGQALGQTVPRASERPRRQAGMTPHEMAAASGIDVRRLSAVQTFAEARGTPRTGTVYHAAAMERRVDSTPTGYVIVREHDGQRVANVVWAKR